MSVSTPITVDPADVATVDALGPQVRALMAAIEQAGPALERLEAAQYPGLEWVTDEVYNIQAPATRSAN